MFKVSYLARKDSVVAKVRLKHLCNKKKHRKLERLFIRSTEILYEETLQKEVDRNCHYLENAIRTYT